MKKRTLGNSGLEVSALGLGCMGMSFGLGQAINEKDGITLIRTQREAFPMSNKKITQPEKLGEKLKQIREHLGFSRVIFRSMNLEEESRRSRVLVINS